jgi:hypothetical protein
MLVLDQRFRVWMLRRSVPLAQTDRQPEGLRAMPELMRFHICENPFALLELEAMKTARICPCGSVETDQAGAELTIRTGSAWSVHTQEVWLCPDCWRLFDARLGRAHQDAPGGPLGLAVDRLAMPAPASV